MQVQPCPALGARGRSEAAACSLGLPVCDAFLHPKSQGSRLHCWAVHSPNAAQLFLLGTVGGLSITHLGPNLPRNSCSRGREGFSMALSGSCWMLPLGPDSPEPPAARWPSLGAVGAPPLQTRLCMWRAGNPKPGGTLPASQMDRRTDKLLLREVQ